MSTITVEVPDELAERLEPFQNQLPRLLALAVELLSVENFEAAMEPIPTSPLVFREIMNFLISRPTPEQIIAFKIAPAAQTRLEELLAKNQDEELTPEEAAELDSYAQINHLIILLKAHARSTLASPKR